MQTTQEGTLFEVQQTESNSWCCVVSSLQSKITNDLLLSLSLKSTLTQVSIDPAKWLLSETETQVG